MIEILEMWAVEDESPSRTALIAISDEGTEYALHVGGIPAEGDAQAHLEARFDELWQVAQRKGAPFDVVEALRERAILKRIIVLLVEELNILREEVGLPPRTMAQLKRALRDAVYE